MELHKIEDVDFTINHGYDSQRDINLVWKEGQLYLSLKNLFLTDGKIWYDMPIKELENVQVISENPTKLRFQMPSVEVIVSGKFAERLLALRHFLLPFLDSKRKKIMEGSLGYLIKFWSLGVREPKAFTTLMPLTVEEVRKLITTAREQGFITSEGGLTEKAYEMLQPNERELLRSLEVTDG